MNSLEAWLAKLNKPQANKTKSSLARVKQIAEALELLPVTYKTIVIAGTNGKGTSAHLLAAIYKYSGFKTGLYTSPHLLRFNERIVVDHDEITDAALVQAFEAISAIKGAEQLNYYEYTTLAALYYFRKTKVDVAILEVGIGGRLDACNIVDATLAVITNVDLDHTEWLGEDREKISLEKAGVMRKNTPAVCGDLDCPQPIIDYAAKLNAPLFKQQQDFFALVGHDSWEWRCLDEIYALLPIPQMPVQNAATVLMSIRCLKKYLPVSREAIDRALLTTRVSGRYQVFQLKCPVILDVAHNVSAANWLAERLKSTPCEGRTIGVFSALNDKDVVGIIHQIEPIV